MIRELLDPENFVAAKFAWHQCIVRDPDLSLQAKAVAGFVLHDLNAREGCAWRGQEGMAEALGIGVRQLRRLMDDLSRAGYLQIEVRRGRGRTNICRATLPLDRPSEPKQKRPPAAAEPVKMRSATSAEAGRNRTGRTKKPDVDGRQYLEDSIDKFARARRSVESSKGLPPPFERSDIRLLVRHLGGEAAAVSYLDGSRWDDQEKCVICRTETGFTRLTAIAGDALSRLGVSICAPQKRAGQIAA